LYKVVSDGFELHPIRLIRGRPLTYAYGKNMKEFLI